MGVQKELAILFGIVFFGTVLVSIIGIINIIYVLMK
jgi:hypothetical protein